jgi:ADP-ribose pyrophosphatase YjhB (NUDIX family)
MSLKWLQWAKEIQAISQTGLHFTDNIFDIQRYNRLKEISSEIIAEHTNLEIEDIIEYNKSEFGYATPKVDVRGAVFRDNKILLVSEKLDNGRWTLPGGWADVNESPKEAVEREILEESGYKAQVIKILAVYDREKQNHYPPFPQHVYKLFYLCKLTGGKPSTSIETEDVGFFDEDNLPELSLSRVTSTQIRRFFEFHRNPLMPTDFD